MYRTNKQRREQVLNQLPKDAIVVISGARKVHRSVGQTFPFSQDSSFFYLTSWPEPDAVCVFGRFENQVQSVLFHKGLDAVDEKWHGVNLSHADACEHFGFDQALPITALNDWLGKNIKAKHAVYMCDQDERQALVRNIVGTLDMSVLSQEIMRLRLNKSPEEIQDMKTASQITAAAHLHTMQQGMRGLLKTEREIAATFQYYCLMHGADSLAYETIAAQGENACILHYTKNNKQLWNNECVLLDAGCSVNHYCADVTRTWPISGKFTDKQRVIYDLVLKAHQMCIERVSDGVAYQALQKLSQEVIIDGLKQMNIIDNKVSDESLFKTFYGHGIGHSIGLDVHDPSPMRADFILSENAVITIEPGIYLSDNPALVDKQFSGIGIRIEDDILVEKHGCTNLTSAAPVQIDDIESLAYG